MQLLSLALALPLAGLVAAIPSDPAACPTLPGYNQTRTYTGPVDLATCQKPKAQGYQLDGCPANTLYVSQTDPQAPFGRISDAVAAMPVDDSSVTILVGPGNYHEQVNITSPRTGPVSLIGITEKPKDYKKNAVRVWFSAFICQKNQRTDQKNADAAVLTVDFPSASGPAGHTTAPGIFTVANIDFANKATWGNGTEAKGQTGPAAATFFTWTNATSIGCSYSSYQDTWYVGRNSSVLSVDEYISGGTDFIYGYGLAWFSKAVIASREVGGGLTAMKADGEPEVKTVVWHPLTNIGAVPASAGFNFGVYIDQSRIVKADDALPELQLTGQRALGRPWGNASRVIYQDSYMSDIVLPAGFIKWSDTDPRIVPNLTNFIETGSHGPGFNLAARLNNSNIQTTYTKKEMKAGMINGKKTYWTIKDVFGEEKPKWVDWSLVGQL